MATKNEELEKAAIQYQESIGEEQYFPEDVENAFKAGAEWQKQQSEQEITKWISIKEKLPEFDKDVLVLDYGTLKVAKYRKQFMSNRKYWDIDGGSVVTHWMPIPELPK